jgi:hypothetical protein
MTAAEGGLATASSSSIAARCSPNLAGAVLHDASSWSRCHAPATSCEGGNTSGTSLKI